MRILFAGTPEAAVPSLMALAEHFEIAAVLTRPDAPAGRGRVLTPSPVKQAAVRLGIPVWCDDPSKPEFVQKLHDLNVDAAAVVAYGRILKQPVLDAVPGGWYNLHFSLLPDWRGAAPVQRAIWAGDAVTGVTVFKLTAGMDEGPVVARKSYEIADDVTTGQLMGDLAAMGSAVLVEAFGALAQGTASLTPQSEIAADHERRADKITHDDAHADFSLPAAVVSQHIRACNPDPGAWCTVSGSGMNDLQLRLGAVSVAAEDDPALAHARSLRAEAADGDAHAGAAGVAGPAANDAVSSADVPGALIISKKHVWVTCGQGTAVELRDVTAQGKRRMSGADWARGARLPHDARCA